MICAICKQPIEVLKPAIQLSGGFFQPMGDGGPPAFVMDDNVLGESFIHRECLDMLIKADVKVNRTH